MKEKVGAVFLVVLGLLQMAGDLLHLPIVKGVAAGTGASPAPKVFSAVKGLETFSTEFFIEWQDKTGKEHSLHLTPELYAKVAGPYNRRNVYGATLAYAPILASDKLTKPMFDSVTRYAFGGKAPLLRELGIDPETIAGTIRIRLVPRPGTKPQDHLPLNFEVSRDE